MKRWLVLTAVLLGLAFLLPGTEARAASVTVVLPQVSGAKEGEIRVPVSVRAAQGLGPLQLDLLFDANQLEFVQAAAGTGLSVGLFDFHLIERGRLRLVLTGDPNQPIQGDGELCAVVFRATPAAAGKSVLQAEKVRAWEQTREALEMRVAVEAGSVTVSGRSLTPWLIGAGTAGLVLILLAVKGALGRKPVSHPAPVAAPTGQSSGRNRFCSQCGAPQPDAAKFCPICGHATAG